MRRLILLTFLFTGFSIFAQNEGNVWYFGENAGLDFSTSPPTALSNGQIDSLEGCSAISDNLGNLLFYTDGVTIYNRNHSPMPNGTGLNGNTSSAQSAIIVKDPSIQNTYFIITVRGSLGVSYSMVNMNYDNGLGDIIPGRKNIQIRSSAHEKVAIVPHSNGSQYWVILFDQGTYYSYKLTSGLILTNGVVTSQLSLTNILSDRRGILKSSPDGSKLINTSAGGANRAFLTSFDNTTGAVSNPINLTTNSIFNRFFGAEFSPSSNLVYLNGNSTASGNTCGTSNQREILQYEILGFSGWEDNPILIGGSIGANSGRGQLQLAPNGKIYFARTCQQWLGVINSPNTIGINSFYVDDGVQLALNTRSREGLPYLSNSILPLSKNEVYGTIKFDVDGNGCSQNDLNFQNVIIRAASGGAINYDFTDSDGNYKINLTDASHIIEPLPENPTYWSFSPQNVVVDFPTQASPFMQDFCVTANGVNEDLEVIVVPLEQARPGFDTDYKVVIKNKGNVTSSGSVALDFEEDFMTLVSTNPNAGNTPSNQLSWSFSNLQPFQMEEYEFTMTLNTPTATVNPLNGGDMLTFTGTVTGTGTDAMPADNVMVFDQTVVNSYDPNDKTCLEGETIDPADVGEYVHYMIRFENTGTASAINLIVQDFIDRTKFDITTLVPLSSSHTFFTRIRERQLVEFIFEDINLDFNDATNDGYVLFKIKTLNSLSAGDTFDNTAEIFFDFNFPIITNTETVTVMSTASIGESTDSSISFYPNPATDFINISSSNGLESATIIDVNGRMLSQTSFTGNATSQRVSLQNLNSGIYFVAIKSDLGQKVEKLIVE